MGMSAPLRAGAANPVVAGNIILSYTATDANIQSVSISYASITDETNWTEIYSLENNNILSALYDFDTKNPLGDGVPLTDGEYLVKVSALDYAGNTKEVVIHIDVDNTVPEINITQPTAGNIILGTTNITGTVSDEHLYRYYVKLGAGADPASYSMLAAYTSSVTGGVLHQWSPPEAEGIYTLMIEAVDISGNKNESSVTLSLDTIKPAVPDGFTVTLNELTQPELSWNANPGTDNVTGYNIYRDSALLTNLTVTSYTDTEDITGFYSYYVTAIDNNGNESEPTNTIMVNVDKIGPTVAITSPNATDSYTGLVVVKGSATSNDFKEYKLRYVVGTVTDDVTLWDTNYTWEHVRTSPIPITNGVLGFFYIDIPDFMNVVTLRLTGIDTSDNVSETKVEVNIDNVPPAQPTGLTATVQNTNEIHFSWDANTETDIAGYDVLLYGNNLISQLITDTTYTYL
jgi:hypothetical protein